MPDILKYNKYDLYIYIDETNYNMYEDVIEGIKEQFMYNYLIAIKSIKKANLVPKFFYSDDFSSSTN